MSDIEQQQAVAAVNAQQQAVAAVNAVNGNRGEMAEPDDDELGDEIVLVRNGWVRMTIAGRLYKLRRPFFGELRDLEASAESDRDVLTELNNTLRAESNEHLARAKEIEEEAKGLADDSPRKLELDEEATSLTLAAFKRQTTIMRRAGELRESWWRQVFETLSPPGHEKPRDMPAWIDDAQMQQRIVDHWRTAPLAYGNR